MKKKARAKKNSRGKKPRITAFVCRASQGAVQHRSVEEAFQGHAEVRTIELVCSGQIRTGFILSAFEAGADGVCLITCPEDRCRYGDGSPRSLEVYGKARRLLASIGIEEERLARFPMTPANTRPPTPELKAFLASLNRLGELAPS